MAKYNFAQGGDVHYNANRALYPQNAFVKDQPEWGASTTKLKPAHHWEGGHYAPVRHIKLNDACYQCGLSEAASNLEAGDSFSTHVIPSMSLMTGFHYKIHTPLEGAKFTVKLAADGTTIGEIDASVAGDDYFHLADPIYIPGDTNDMVEFVLDEWPDPVDTTADENDPCGIYAGCGSLPNFCFTSTAFYWNPRAEDYCEDTCYDSCGC